MSEKPENDQQQIERADEEAARAAAAAEEAVEAAASIEGAADSGAEVDVEAAVAAEEAADEAQEAADTAAKPKRARAKQAAAVAPETPAADEAGDEPAAEEPAAEEAGAEAPAAEAAKPSRRRRTKTADEQPKKAAKPARRRDERRELPAGVTVRAQARYVRTSARKARLVCDHIRGKDVAEARAILAFTPRAAAKDWAKLLESAVANAEHNHELVGEDLRIAAVYADEGPTLKRYRPRAMGRATRIRKRTSHLTITLSPKEH